MIKFNVNELEFLKAIEKASISVKDSYIITISNREYKGKKLANITACDGNSQAMATMIVEAEKPFRVIVGVELLTVVKTLSRLKKGIIFELEGNNITIKAGLSTVELVAKEEGMSIDVSNIRNEENVIEIVMNSEKFIAGIKGAVYPATSLDNVREILQDTVCFVPCDSGLRLISSNGSVVAGADVVIEKGNENFSKSKQEKNYLSVSAAAINKVASHLDVSKTTTIYMIPKQLLINNGNDFYIIRPYEKAFPMAVSSILYKENRNYQIKMSASELKVALDIAVLDSSENTNKRAIISLNKNGKVKISSIYKKNKSILSAITHDGEMTIALSAEYLKKIVDVISCDNVILSGTNSIEPIYVTGENNNSLISLVSPINLDKVNKKVIEEKEDSKEEKENVIDNLQN